MMRTTSTAVVAAVSLFVAMPLTAQEHIWDRDRPDAHAPIGLLSDVTLSSGELLFTYRYSREAFEGLRVGTDFVSFDEAFDFDYTTVPADMTTESHEVALRYGITDNLTVSGMIPFRFKQMTNLTEDGDVFYLTDSNDLGDIEGRLMYDVFETGPYRAHITLGGSAPTGEISDRDLTPESFPEVTQLPYAMQMGSGTFDFLPSIGFSAQNEVSTIGVQTAAVLRMFENRHDYKLGNAASGTVWAAYMLNDWLSLSTRIVWETWADISGDDARTDGAADSSANPFATGGSRTYLPFGVNILMREGPLAGMRFALEWQYVISENLNGPQLAQDDGLVIGWQMPIF